MSEGLIAFLSARLDEDASCACATFRPSGPRWSEVGHGERIPEMAHIERHSPDRTLREVAAGRAILAEADRIAQSASTYPNQGNAAALIAMQTVLKILSVVYSDRPDYRPEWAP